MANFRIIFVLFLAGVILTLTGCGLTTVKKTEAGPDKKQEQERTLAAAVHNLRSGNEQGAYNLLELVVSGPKNDGITDEALFRLALLQLRSNSARSMARAEQLLERLGRDFPQSVWAHQAAPLRSFLGSANSFRKQKRELNSLREQNLSLTRNNRELRQTIERLKNLDIELEQKNKH